MWDFQTQTWLKNTPDFTVVEEKAAWRRQLLKGKHHLSGLMEEMLSSLDLTGLWDCLYPGLFSHEFNLTQLKGGELRWMVSSAKTT